VHPETGRIIVIEMNPRVSRSSALASKATGFPIAKIAAKLAIGYRLDEIPNDITKVTPASFEPTLDYIVVKVPRFAFEKFPAADATLTTTMKSVGEAMAIGRNFTQALQKALRSLERKGSSFHWNEQPLSVDELLELARTPTDGRIVFLQQALLKGATLEQAFEATKIDPWFIDQIQYLNEIASELRNQETMTAEHLRFAKSHGFSDVQIASIRGLTENQVREIRYQENIRPVYKTVDTCAGEFPALTPYHYSSYEQETEVRASDKQKIVIIGSGPNRIGQGVEFDYSCVHASFALSAAGFETIMINCNPETVSTDYDTSDRLYFEPLTLEDVLEVIHAESASGELVGVVVQLGGQTALGLAKGLAANGVRILGTSPEAIDLAEERGAFSRILDEAGLRSPANGTATNLIEAVSIAERIGYPVLVRPSFVLGGRGMEIVYDSKALEGYFDRIADQAIVGPEHPLLVDRFLDDAIEIDIDALYDGEQLYVGGVMEHIEEAGIHSGDSSCTLPPITLSDTQIDRVRVATEKIANGIGVRGLLNVQFALAHDVLYVLEANPRASRTVPFVSKALGITLAKAASLVMVGKTISELVAQGHLPEKDGTHIPQGSAISVKEAVLPFKRFATKDGRFVDSLLGPEMRSTGEVMGIDVDFPTAFAKSQAAAGSALPKKGTIFVSVADRDKHQAILPVRRLSQLGYEILATAGTASILERHGIKTRIVRKHSADDKAPAGPTIVELIAAGEVDAVINTPSGSDARKDGYEIRAATTAADAPIFTTITQISAAIGSFEKVINSAFTVRSLQEHAEDRRASLG
jgi:carbamoyl-phosphate synthase large subunit